MNSTQVVKRVLAITDNVWTSRVEFEPSSASSSQVQVIKTCLA